MTCLTCTHWELRRSLLRAMGFGLCAKELGILQRAKGMSPTAACDKHSHTQATPDTITAREKALKRI